MSATSFSVTLSKSTQEAIARDDKLYSGGNITVSGIRGPDAIGPFATDEQLTRLVDHALAFNKKVLCVYDLGDNIPPIAVTQGSRKCWGAGSYHEDDDSIHYTVTGNGFESLGHALAFALATRDRGNPNDARYTAEAIQRLLEAPPHLAP